MKALKLSPLHLDSQAIPEIAVFCRAATMFWTKATSVFCAFDIQRVHLNRGTVSSCQPEFLDRGPLCGHLTLFQKYFTFHPSTASLPWNTLYSCRTSRTKCQRFLSITIRVERLSDALIPRRLTRSDWPYTKTFTNPARLRITSISYIRLEHHCTDIGISAFPTREPCRIQRCSEI